ncbi:MAG: sugar phosphate isomerase/epimerase [Planctomycetota bacterium]
MRQLISLSTTCTPWLPLDELAPLAAASGYAGLDLACKPHRFDSARAPSFWDNNAAVIDLDRLEYLVPVVARLLGEWRLLCPLLASYAQAEDLVSAKRLARAARVLGTPLVRMCLPRAERGIIASQFSIQRVAWRELARLAADESVRFVVETSPITLATGASSSLRLLDGLDPKQVGVVFDVGNTVRVGTEPLEQAIELLGDYLAHIQVKDVWRRSGGSSWDGSSVGFAPLGEGVLRWPTIISTLKAAGYDRWLGIDNLTGLDVGPSRVGADASWLRDQLEAAGMPAHVPANKTIAL